MYFRLIILHFLYAISIIFITACDSYAWNFKEYMKIGEDSYSNACEDLSENFKDDSKYKLACTKVDGKYYYAEIYGQLCAIAADHLSSPEEFRNKFSGRKIASFKDMGLIAMQNSDHFHPYVVRFWVDYHDKA